MKDYLKNLDETLAEEIRVEKDLLAAGTQKRDALVALDMKGVDRATARERSLLMALAPVAERRLRRTSETAHALGLAEAEFTVTRIAQRAGEPYCTRLLARADELRRTLKDVARVNGSNKLLTEQSLLHVKEFFRLLGGGGAGEMLYTRRGLETRPETPKVMIDEVA